LRADLPKPDDEVTMPDKRVLITDFLTEEEIALASQMWRGRWLEDGKSYAQRVADLIIRPNIERINKALGQENDPMFLACAVEYVLGSALRSDIFNQRGSTSERNHGKN
jgi:hypothetical protein